MYKAEMILDSISPANHRIATMVVTMPRCILAEFNTHRMLSRNSASSRAIPLHKMVAAVRTNPFIPLRWMKNHSGMQGTEYFGDRETFTSTNPFDKNARGIDADETGHGPGGTRIIIDVLKEGWLWLQNIAIQEAQVLNNHGVHYHPDGDTSKLCGDGVGLTKQMCNRLLEPWMWHTVLVTATEWDNFFALRVDPAAEIHMQKVAETMLECMNNSKPKDLKYGEWHIPYGSDLDMEEVLLKMKYRSDVSNIATPEEMYEYYALRIATARCAQVSYTVIGEDNKNLDYEKLVALHDRLASSGHWSPFEHCARAMSPSERSYAMHNGYSGNFRGWKQYRKTFNTENRTDNRLIKHTYGASV